MARKVSEATIILRNSTKERLSFLHKLNQDDELREGMKSLLNEILHTSEAKIARSAAIARSIDEMISISISQAFDKGRISSSVLIWTLIANASKELESREGKGK